MIAYKGKGFGIGVFDNRSGLTIPTDNIWYSFDDNFWNCHIVPEEKTQIFGEEKNLSEWLRDRLDDIITSFQNDDNISHVFEEKIRGNRRKGTLCIKDTECKWTRSEGNKESTINHKWIEIECNNYTYLLLPCRLWCDETNHVNSNFGQVQFMRYPTEDKQINRVKTNKTRNYKGVEKPVYEFRMMYPKSADHGTDNYHSEENRHTEHYIYNPHDLDIERPKEIAKEFIKFIKGELV